MNLGTKIALSSFVTATIQKEKSMTIPASQNRWIMSCQINI